MQKKNKFKKQFIIIKYLSFKKKRIDKYLVIKLKYYSRSFIQKQFKNNNITVRQQKIKSNYILSYNDKIEIHFLKKEIKIIPKNILLSVLYEDNSIIILNKPKNVIIHPYNEYCRKTLVNAILYHYKNNLSKINGKFKPGIIHRIDKNTTGLILICKTNFTHIFLAKQFKQHNVIKYYRAIVYNNFKINKGVIIKPIKHNHKKYNKMSIDLLNGKYAITYYKVLEQFNKYAYIECKIKTGRTHQIRIHMNSIGHPILGDKLYGIKKHKIKSYGQTLHAIMICFIHPDKKKYMNFYAPLPKYFKNILKILQKKK